MSAVATRAALVVPSARGDSGRRARSPGGSRPRRRTSARRRPDGASSATRPFAASVRLDDGEDDDVASSLPPSEANDEAQPVSRLSNVCFVLCRPQGPANVGGIARVMNNFGITDLRIVAPEPGALAPPFDATMDDGSDRATYSTRERSTAPLADEARIMAVHASGLLENAGRFETAARAVADCVFVAATTARPRENLPIVSIRDACRVDANVDASDASSSSSSSSFSSISAFTNEGKVAILFGNEATGLTNEELALANVGVMIPTAGFDVPDASGVTKKNKKKTKRYTGGVGPTSLNLSHAVGVCAYEVHQAIGNTNVSGFNSRLITAEDRVRLADELHAARRALDVLSSFGTSKSKRAEASRDDAKATTETNETETKPNANSDASSRLESLEHARERRAILNVLNAGPIASRDAAAFFSFARRVVDVSRFSGTDGAILEAARVFDAERVASGREPFAFCALDSDKGRAAVKALIKAVRDTCGVSMTTRETERVIEALGKRPPPE